MIRFDATEPLTAKVFPWMLALSPADRETCAQELVDAARASFSKGELGTITRGSTSFERWQHKPTAKGSARLAGNRVLSVSIS